MEKEFVPYELALRMKQLGFDEPCLAFYGDENDFSMDSSRKNNPFRKTECVAPLFQQAFRWFREKGDLHYQLIPFFSDKESHAVDYYLAIAQHRPPIQVKTFEEAQLACLTKLIEIVELNARKSDSVS
jgi:hypothetical protein